MKIIRPFLSTITVVILAMLALHDFGATASAQATRIVTITDPILNMQAYSLLIPANWIFDGAVIPGTSCNDGPFPVFRMMSPDGLTGVKRLPRLDWTWADNNGKPLKSGEECLPYKREVPAAEVLKYMVGERAGETRSDERRECEPERKWHRGLDAAGECAVGLANGSIIQNTNES